MKNKKQITKIVLGIITLCLIGASYYFYNQKQEVLFKNYLSTAEQQFRDEDYTNAIRSLTEAIKIRPKDLATYRLRAYSYYWNGQADEALGDTDTYISLNRDEVIKSPVDFFLLRGDIFMVKNQTDLALEAYSNAYSESTTDEDVVSGYAFALNLNGEYEKAYTVIVKYFDELDGGVLLEDVGIDIWLARGMSAVMIRRCLDASTSALHVLDLTEEGDINNNIAQKILYNAGNDEKCIDYIKN